MLLLFRIVGTLSTHRLILARNFHTKEPVLPRRRGKFSSRVEFAARSGGVRFAFSLEALMRLMWIFL